MIIEKQEDVTRAVLAELEGAKDPRFKEIMVALVRHLHGFAREVRLTEEEFQKAIACVVAVGKKTTPSHNEGVLMSGSLGLSALVCLGAALALFRFKVGVMPLLAACAAVGLAVSWLIPRFS